MNEEITVLIKKPNEEIKVQSVENTVANFEFLLGGTYSELELPFLNCNVFYNVNANEKNLKFLGLELTGTVIFTGSTVTGEVISLPLEDIPSLKRMIRASNLV